MVTGVGALGAAADNGHGRGDRAERNVVAPTGKDPRDRPDTKLSVEGSTRNRGYQHTSANTAGGSSNVQNALCRRSRVCNITQHVTVTGPRETERPALRPTPVPTVTVTVTATPSAPAPAAPAPVATAAPSCPARSLIRVDARVSVSAGLIGGLVSLSTLGKSTACPGLSG
ncbi:MULTISPECIES: hypothetical protein [unclassified Microbispora]|uniref:hypothetical protein n=1 Tax=unclassified Microbispora TaxID=2614687 RepID=UPI001B8BB6AE|nr:MULTISPECIES: hypothetical protein [unclassified Microbispora]